MTDQPVTITLSAETVRWVKLAAEEIERVKWDIRPWGPGNSAIAAIHSLIERGGDARVVKLVDEMQSLDDRIAVLEAVVSAAQEWRASSRITMTRPALRLIELLYALDDMERTRGLAAE